LRVVAEAVDSRGMIGGQVADMESTGQLDRELLEFIHKNKTGKLLTASVLLGGLLGNATDAQLAALEAYGNATGLAFQIVDDLLDLEASSEQLGKTAGKDVAQGKLTYPALMGVEAARAEAARLLGEAIANADKIAGPAANYLAQMARYICERRS
jgi:geranylgeranyl diphosphate synthase type II